MPAWYFFGLDLLILAFVGLTVVTSSPLDWPRILICAIAIGLGAVLAAIPFWNHYQASDSVVISTSSQVPKWLVAESNESNGHPRRFIVHLHQPVFIGEIVEIKDQKPIVTPVWIEGPLPEASAKQLKREAELMLRI